MRFKMIKAIIFTSLLFIFSASLLADLLPEGKKRIDYSFELTNINSYPDYTFIAYPFNNSNGAPDIIALIIKDGSNINPSCKYGSPKILAVKTADFDKELFDSINSINESNIRNIKLEKFFSSEKFISSKNVQCEAYANRDAKYYYINEQYSIENISSELLAIKSKKIIYKDKNKNIIDAEDSKSFSKDDVVSPASEVSSYLIIIIPILALIALITVLVIRKMKK